MRTDSINVSAARMAASSATASTVACVSATPRNAAGLVALFRSVHAWSRARTAFCWYHSQAKNAQSREQEEQQVVHPLGLQPVHEVAVDSGIGEIGGLDFLQAIVHDGLHGRAVDAGSTATRGRTW